VPTLRIEHPVPDYDNWKRAFDADPVDRRAHGVRRYRVSRAVDDPSYVLIDLEFDSMENAERLLAKMRQVWAGPGKDVMRNPLARIVETVERQEL
jgi:hypothetical protein